jgi:DNA polymerase III sliding clamp (beta) subunit (PCNA family)
MMCISTKRKDYKMSEVTLEIAPALFMELATVGNIAGTDYSRPVLTAVKFTIKDGEVTATATDSYSLVVMTRETATTDNGEFLVPAKWMMELGKKVKSTKALMLKLEFTDTTITATMVGRDGTATISTDLVGGTYPNLSFIIDGWSPATEPFDFGVNLPLLARFAKVSPLDTKGSHGLKIQPGKSAQHAVKVTCSGFMGLQMSFRMD